MFSVSTFVFMDPVVFLDIVNDLSNLHVFHCIYVQASFGPRNGYKVYPYRFSFFNPCRSLSAFFELTDESMMELNSSGTISSTGNRSNSLK